MMVYLVTARRISDNFIIIERMFSNRTAAESQVQTYCNLDNTIANLEVYSVEEFSD